MEEVKNVKTIAEATEAEDEVLHVYLEKEDAKKHLKPEKKSPFSPKVVYTLSGFGLGVLTSIFTYIIFDAMMPSACPEEIADASAE